MKKLILFITILLTLPQINMVKAQNMDDFEYMFKMSVFYDSTYLTFSNTELSYKEIYSYIQDSMTFTLHPLKQEGFGNNYSFFLVDIESDIEHNSSNEDVVFISGWTSKLVVAVNNNSVYRLKGFRGNDFLSFMYDWMEQNKDFNHRRFFREHSVEGVDFKCLYKSLRAKKKSAERPDCLKRVIDPMGIS